MESDGDNEGCEGINLGNKIEKNKEVVDVKAGEKQNQPEVEALVVKLRAENEMMKSNLNISENTVVEQGQQLVTLKRKLENVESYKAKMVKQDKFVQNLKDRIECPVCYDIPRCGPVPICPNGHIVCSKCKRDDCPTCRIPMGDGKSLIAVAIIETVDHTCKFDNCNEEFPYGDPLEKHETSCSLRTVNCPKAGCNIKVALVGLLNHLLQSSCCDQKVEARQSDLNEWNTSLYRNTLQVANGCWSIDVFKINGEVLAFYPMQSEEFFYFMLIMGATESECTKYEVEMVVHESNTVAEAVDAKVSVRFLGTPLSIDRQRDEFKLFGATAQMMKEIMKMPESKNYFKVSFKLVKK